MEYLNLIIALISGIVGGNAVGASMPDKNLGPVVNSIVGLIGGGAGDFILKALGILATASATGTGTEESAVNITSILTSIGAGGISGGALTAIVALIKESLQKK